MIDIKQYNGKIVTPRDDAILYDFMIYESGVFEGCEVTSLGANQLRVASGRGIIKGRVFVVEEEVILAKLSTSGSQKGRLLIRVDTANTDTPIVFDTQVAAALPALVQDDINHDGTVYELPLATYDVNNVQISNLVPTDIKIEQFATANRYGRVRLSDAINSTSNSAAGISATPLAAKTAYDRGSLGIANAAAAQNTANQGVTNAAAAQNTANTGVTNAAAAQNRADNAYSLASTANTNAANKLDKTTTTAQTVASDVTLGTLLVEKYGAISKTSGGGVIRQTFTAGAASQTLDLAFVDSQARSLGLVIAGSASSVDFSPSYGYSSGAPYTLGNGPRRWTCIYLYEQPNVSSDRRLKENITDISPEAAHKITMSLIAREYTRVDDDSDLKHLGFVAQEVVEAFAAAGVDIDGGDKYSILSQSADENGEPGMYGLAYESFIPILTGAIQQQDVRIAALEQEITALKQALNAQ